MLNILYLKFRKIFNLVFQLLAQLFISIVIFILALVLIFLALTIFIPLKLTVFIIARIFRPDLKHFMVGAKSILGAWNIHRKPKLNMCTIFILDGILEIDQLQKDFQERIMEKRNPKRKGEMLYPELKMYWRSFLNYNFWKDDKNFNLANHVRLFEFESDGGNLKSGFYDVEEGKCFNEEDLNNVAAHLLEKPWKKKRSPWEMLLVPSVNYQSKTQTDSEKCKKVSVLIFRMHHAMADGYSLFKLFNGDLFDPSSVKINFPKFNVWEKIGMNLLLPIKMPWDMAGSFLSRCGTSEWIQPKDSEKLSRNVFTLISKPVDCKLIKCIKNKYGVSYSSVLCTVMASTCRRLMDEAGHNVPDTASCFMALPVPGHPDGLVNHLSGMVFQLSMDPKLSRAERLKFIFKKLTISKFNTVPLGFSTIIKYCNVLPNGIFKIWNASTVAVGMANFAVPSQELACAGGIQMTDCISAVGPGLGKGTYMCSLSCNGKQRFTAIIDKSILSSEKIAAKFADFVQEEITLLLGMDGTNDIQSV